MYICLHSVHSIPTRPLHSYIIIIIIIIIFISSAAFSKIRRAAGTYHSVLTMRCAFRNRVQRWPWTVSTDAVQLVNQWLWVSVAHRVCRRRPTAGVDVLWDERPAGRAQRDTGGGFGGHWKGARGLHIVLTAPPRLSDMHLADALVKFLRIREVFETLNIRLRSNKILYNPHRPVIGFNCLHQRCLITAYPQNSC